MAKIQCSLGRQELDGGVSQKQQQQLSPAWHEELLTALSGGLDLEEVLLCFSQPGSTPVLFCCSSSSLGEATSRALDLGLLLHSLSPQGPGCSWHSQLWAEAVNDLLTVPFPFCKGPGLGCSSRPAWKST